MRLKYVRGFIDRHGKSRYYYRRPGHKPVPLPGLPGTAEFMAAYQAAIEAAVRETSKKAPLPGSLDDAAMRWYQSAGFRKLAPSSQKTYRRLLEAVRAKYGDKLVARIQSEHIEHLMSEHAERPTTANHTLKVIRHVMRFAQKTLRWRRDDPTREVDRLSHTEVSHTAWSEHEISLYEERWPSGTQARLALYIFLYAGVRRSDAVRMGRQHIRDGMIEVRQVKGGKNAPTIEIPLHPKLAAEIDYVPHNQLTLLLTAPGRSFSGNGIYNKLIEWARLAGLPAGRSPHGLRHAQGRRLAEAGCTPHQIAAVLGHKNISETQRYTRAAQQRTLAQDAMEKIGGEGRKRTEVTNLSAGLPKLRSK